jgi:type IV secretory pathway VirB10-like protein
MATRMSSRNAAQKAKEAISSTAEPSGKPGTGTKRKVPPKEAPQPKKEKKEDVKPQDIKPEAPKAEPISTSVDGPSTPKPEEHIKAEEPLEEHAPSDQPPKQAPSIEAGLRKSEERENVVSSNILEKGFIYFFFRPRVNVEDPHSIADVARSFFVLSPTALGAEFNHGQGPVDKGTQCRLMMLPKKKFPTSGRERDMGFVEKAGQSMQSLQENFIAGKTYQTVTKGERHTEEARPYAEGVYAITHTPRNALLAYILTIPAELGTIQEDFGLRERGSWIVQSKNPKFLGPPSGRLPKNPEYPAS